VLVASLDAASGAKRKGIVCAVLVSVNETSSGAARIDS
jgi:hypothetical protein